ncbi:MAG: hypothetical protein GQ574_13820, partial [Crocinitomix sp.]|nr:hypothetical protein [Crocinitomix sp.]
KWFDLIKKKKLKVDEIIFVSWDRFSRNFSEAVSTIYNLRDNYGITPQAIQQPVEFDIPESLLTLSIYLASPDVDNQRRSGKIRDGIRQALKQGRWIRRAIIGYKNERDQFNKPIMVIDPDKAKHIQFAFEAFANGMTQVDIRMELEAKGIKMAKSNFSVLLRRVAYIGKTIVPAYKDEPEVMVDALHEGIIDEDIFYKVQNRLADVQHKSRRVTKTITRRDEIPLRGHLACSKCGETLTGSGSRGKLGKRYFYYHCNFCKKERYSAPLLNDQFEALLAEFDFNADIKRFYDHLLLQLAEKEQDTNVQDIPKIKTKIKVEKERIKNLQDLLADRVIGSDDYKDMRGRYSENIKELQKDLKKINQNKKGREQYLMSSLNLIKNLCNTYQTNTTEYKQRLVGSIFPKKLSFDGNQCRTPILQEVLFWVLSHSNGYRAKKNEQLLKKLQLFAVVEPEGIEPSS